MTIIVPPKVREYLNPLTFSSSSYPNLRDHVGRFLLIGDEVASEYTSDEGIEMLIRGTVIDMDFLDCKVLIEPRQSFLRAGFLKNWVLSHNCYRFPTGSPELADDLTFFFSQINQASIRGRDVHIGGKRLA